MSGIWKLALVELRILKNVGGFLFIPRRFSIIETNNIVDRSFETILVIIWGVVVFNERCFNIMICSLRMNSNPRRLTMTCFRIWVTFDRVTKRISCSIYLLEYWTWLKTSFQAIYQCCFEWIIVFHDQQVHKIFFIWKIKVKLTKFLNKHERNDNWDPRGIW